MFAENNFIYKTNLFLKILSFDFMVGREGREWKFDKDIHFKKIETNMEVRGMSFDSEIRDVMENIEFDLTSWGFVEYLSMGANLYKESLQQEYHILNYL